MKASETTLKNIIEGTNQYIVPLFQRPYSWKEDEWKVLWEDLEQLCENPNTHSHFIGSVVTWPTIVTPEGVTKFLLIDGQQRLTTIFILLALLCETAKEKGNHNLAEEIKQKFITNTFRTGLDYFKLLPTHDDRPVFHALMNGESDGDSSIGKCYRYYERRLRKENTDIEILTRAIINRLSVVSIVLDNTDNPHLVFESLNAKGRPLTQADLIRNYFLMKIPADQQEDIFRQHWKPMQDELGDDLTEYIRHYLMRKGDLVKQSDVYYTLKDRLTAINAIEALKEISTFAGYYKKLISPEMEQDNNLRKMLQRLKRLAVTTAYPFLLNCYHDYALGNLPVQDFINIVNTIENLIIRRFVCGIQTNDLNKIFPALYAQALLTTSGDLAKGTAAILQGRNYPKDMEFKARLTETRLYGGGLKKEKTKFILDSIEESYGHKEMVDLSNLSIEHVMPQSLTLWWQEHLGLDWQVDHDLTLHTLGNLTLTAYNSELSNDSFPEKKTRLANSHLDLNQYFATQDRWRRNEIEQRSYELSEICLKIWPFFGEEDNAPIMYIDVTGRTPRAVSFLGKTFAVTCWRDVMIHTLNTINEVEPDAFENLANEFPRFIGKDSNRFHAFRELDGGYFVEINLSAKNINRFCHQVIEAVGLSMDDWQVELRT